jgi:hypothetical protein
VSLKSSLHTPADGNKGRMQTKPEINTNSKDIFTLVLFKKLFQHNGILFDQDPRESNAP